MPKSSRDRVHAFRQRQRERGLCLECSSKAVKNRVRCKFHLQKAADDRLLSDFRVQAEARKQADARVSKIKEQARLQERLQHEHLWRKIAEQQEEIWKLRDQLAQRRPLYLPGETWWGLDI